MIIYKHDGERKELGSLLEGYLYGLGEVCHYLFGPKAEAAMYQAIGSYFLGYLEREMNISFQEKDPWERYCHIIKVFTSYGFYSHAELDELGAGSYWMTESGQYAGAVWEEQKSWERGTPPCPLWSVILHALAQIDYTIILDSVQFDPDSNGYESTFHFEKIEEGDEGVMERARKEIQGALLPICASCKKIRDDKGDWQALEAYFSDHFDTTFTHGLCQECAERLYPEYINKSRRKNSLQQHGRGVDEPERRCGRDRRNGQDRRVTSLGPKVLKMRSGTERRCTNDRRCGVERRGDSNATL